MKSGHPGLITILPDQKPGGDMSIKHPILAIAMDSNHFLKDSDGNVYTLSEQVKQGASYLRKELNSIKTRIDELTKSRNVVFLTTVLTPYDHAVPIQPKWWYDFLSSLNEKVMLVKDRGTTYAFCSACVHRVPNGYAKYDHWQCPFCFTKLKTTDNVLDNMIRDYEFYKETRPKNKSKPKEETSRKESQLPYLFFKVANPTAKKLGPYVIDTDKKTKLFLKKMDRTFRHIREVLVKNVNDLTYPLNYKGWVDEWYDSHGMFSRLRDDSKVQLAYLSIADSIISAINDINATKQLPVKDDPVWVVYWRNLIVDRQNKRIAFPRFRGRYLQLDDSVVIPEGNYYAEISIDMDDKISLRFVMAGNLPPKYEPIDGKHNRGRHRRNTREPRTKTFH